MQELESELEGVQNELHEEMAKKREKVERPIDEVHGKMPSLVS